MKCFQDLKSECNPRKCSKECYIKDKMKNVLKIFNSDNPHDRQIEVNNIALDTFQLLADELLDEVIELTYNKTKRYPSIEAINIIRNRIKGIKEI
jgi:hypothetical protein